MLGETIVKEMSSKFEVLYSAGERDLTEYDKMGIESEIVKLRDLHRQKKFESKKIQSRVNRMK